MSKILYKLAANKSMQMWTIEGESDPNGFRPGIIVIRYGQVGGALQEQTETVSGGKAGRTLEQQMESRINSRINKQLDKGYRHTPEDARKLSHCNTLNLNKPMLATQCKNPSSLNPLDFYVQYKYDGHRCLITKQGGVMRAYSRQGKWITTIDHILQSMDLPEGWIIDGELYHHGTSLQTISSWAKRLQENTLKLKFIVYDVIANTGYRPRYNFLKNDLVYHSSTVMIAPTGQIHKSVGASFKSARAKGYEGLILRHKEMGYESGKRSKGLLKVKKLDQAYIEREFDVLDVVPSKDGWGILICQTDDGKPFRASAPGNMAKKRQVLFNKPAYIGGRVTIEFPNWTDEGKPFQPVALRFVDQI